MNGKAATRGAASRMAVGLVVALGLAACDSLLEVEAASRVLAEDLETAESVPLLVRSAIGDFDCAFAQYIETTSQVVDEFDGSHIFSAEAFDYDRRTVNPARQQYATNECSQYGAIYQPLSTAIWQADNALRQLNTFTDADIAGRTTLIEQASAYGAYGRVLLGEGFCTAAINLGPEMTSEEIFQEAEALFEVAVGSSDPQIANFARLGRARTRLNLGDTQGALADALAIPADFRHEAGMSGASVRTENRIYDRNNRDRNINVSPANRNVEWMGVPDPRVVAINTGDIAVDGFNIVWIQTKYTSVDDPMPIARYAEAQLIIAEIEGGQTAVDIINEFHTANGLPPFAGGTDQEILDHVIQERARELFAESHRFWDVRRHEIPFDPPVGAPYQNKGGFYGDMRCFPLPNIERDNNPNIGSG